MRNEADIEAYWERELGESVTILAMGWVHSPAEYSLHVGGTHIVTLKRLEEIEDYLASYFMKRDLVTERGIDG